MKFLSIALLSIFALSTASFLSADYHEGKLSKENPRAEEVMARSEEVKADDESIFGDDDEMALDDEEMTEDEGLFDIGNLNAAPKKKLKKHTAVTTRR